MFALVDCNSFYASCEQVFRPDLRGKPVVVLSNNDGCIIARSPEAKVLGIPELKPYFQIEGLLRQHGVTVFSSNYALYGDLSQRVMATLGRFSPRVEPYSIDEMFLDMAGTPGELKDVGHVIRRTIWREVRIPVDVGIAPTKTLAKLANHAAKKIPTLEGSCVLREPAQWEWLLRRVAVDKIWGIGKRLRDRLEPLGIRTGWDLAQADAKQLRQQFSVNLERTQRELNGIPCLALEEVPPNKQQIYSTRSFGEKTRSLAAIQEAVSLYAARAAEKLRRQQHLVTTLHVFLHTSPFQGQYYSNSVVVGLPYPTDDTRLIAGQARRAVATLHKPEHDFIKVGVGLVEIVSKEHRQVDLFDAGQDARTDALMLSLDGLNRRYGRGTLIMAAEGLTKRWSMRQAHKSPAYTTSWQQLPSVAT